MHRKTTPLEALLAEQKTHRPKVKIIPTAPKTTTSTVAPDPPIEPIASTAAQAALCVRTPAERQEGSSRREYYAPKYLPSSEVRLHDIIGCDGVAAIPAERPHRFDHPILVQAIATYDVGHFAELYVLSLVGTDPPASVIVKIHGPSYHLHSREPLSDEEEGIVISFIEAVFDGSFTEIPGGSVWRSRDLLTNVANPFSSGKTWADVKAK